MMLTNANGRCMLMFTLVNKKFLACEFKISKIIRKLSFAIMSWIENLEQSQQDPKI